MHLNNIKKYDKKSVYVMGDSHTLDFVDLIRLYGLKDFVLIHCGDAGEGFNSQEMDQFDLDRLEEFCEDNNGDILIVRGNHSNPSFYRPKHWTLKYKRVTFVPDYTYFEINGKVVLFVGGATSIDRTLRTVNKDYWVDETFILRDDYKSLPQADILVTHSASIDAPPVDGLARIQYYLNMDVPLRGELINERSNIKKLVEHIKPKISLNGHFHSSSSVYVDDLWYRGLAISELIELPI